ncbi:type IV secretion system protein [Phenylobacterium sp. VNQ135]|uniref:type IV secretion system protein n=1 Tax=Phenylobacterium sp. VNQ135 TaxID=3400922 RepID=UPI003C085A61
MPQACPLPSPEDPLVSSLLRSTDCRVGTLARSGYDALFTPSGTFTSVLTVLLTVYVALIGYRLLLGRSPMNVSELALSAVKIGAVVALATQWGTYQTVVYRLLFDGPQQIGTAILHNLGASGAAYGGDVFSGLQRAFDNLTAFSPAAPPGSPAAAEPQLPMAGVPAPAPASPSTGVGVSSLLSKPGFDSLLLQGSAIILLISTLGVLLASKIALGLLLGLGPIFLALFLFDATRGLFEGWLRATLGFAFAPLSTTLVLGLGLALLSPALAAIETMRETRTYMPGVAYGVLILVVVLAVATLGLSIAAGVIATGFRLPRASRPPARQEAVERRQTPAPATQTRAERVAAAAVSQDRRTATTLARSVAALSVPQDRSEGPAASGSRPRDGIAPDVRLGQAPRRNAQPRLGRGLRGEA